jgi:sn-glycerol 3-phosphate transport system permease protein
VSTHRRESPRPEQRSIRLASYGLLIPLSVVMVVPLAWLVLTAFKSRSEIFQAVPRWLPEHWTLLNFPDAWHAVPFAQYYVNTILAVGGLTLLQLGTTTLAAYAFARLTFPGADVLFVLFLTQLIISPSTTILPNYLTVKSLGLLNTRTAIILPYIASAFGIFLLRQAFRQIPRELEDSARMDGCGTFRFLWHIALPLVRPALLTFILMSVSFHWNEFFWPLIVTDSNAARTLTIGLSIFAQQTESGAEWTLLMAGTLIVVAPLIVLFLVFQRRFVQSFMHSGIKG